MLKMKRSRSWLALLMLPAILLGIYLTAGVVLAGKMGQATRQEKQPPVVPELTATVTPCSMSFSDVPPGNPFYPTVRCLTCRGIVSGYADGTFRPNSLMTRGQLAKTVSNAAGFDEVPNGQTFEDVPPGSTYYTYVQRLASRYVVIGYPCGTTSSEPCVLPTYRYYYRPNATADRGQIAKIVATSAHFSEPVTTQTFEDVPSTSTYYAWIERLANRSVMGGYPCGSTGGEPCIAPTNRPYFRPGSTATRGQVTKVAANTFYPSCDTP